jgi:glucose/arabinose dehydrogenase
MAFDHVGGSLWMQENGDDSFDEINRVDSGMNGGWVQTIGPMSRVEEFRAIEMGRAPSHLQQLRWPPTNLAETPLEAQMRLFMLPGARYADPEFSWKYAVAPAAIGFVTGDGLGAEYNGDLLVGASRPTLAGGYLFRFRLAGRSE